VGGWGKGIEELMAASREWGLAFRIFDLEVARFGESRNLLADA